MAHLENRALLVESIDALLVSQAALPNVPRPYQVEMWRSAREWLSDRSGSNRAYVSQATGLGKTFEYAALIKHSVGLRSLVVVPTLVLIEQAVNDIAPLTGGMLGHLSSLSAIKNSNDEIVAVRNFNDCDTLITSDASMSRHARTLQQLFNPHVVYRDECHVAYSPSRAPYLDMFAESVIIGLTATPDYLSRLHKPGFDTVVLPNGRLVYCHPDKKASAHFGTLLDQRSLEWGIENGYSSPIAWAEFPLGVSLDSVGLAMGSFGLDFDAGKIERRIGEKWSDVSASLIKLYNDPDMKLRDRQVVVVCPGGDSCPKSYRINGADWRHFGVRHEHGVA